MTTSRLLFAALVLAASSGCARERVAYEMSLTSEPVRRSYRAPRPASAYQHQPVGPMYPHGAAHHACNAACDEYWPDVYPHGQAEHSCDGTCPSYAEPRPTRRRLTVDHSQSFTTGASTGVSTTTRFTGVSTAYEAQPYDTEPYDAEPYNTYAASSRVVVYRHGHSRHSCSASCSSFYPQSSRHVGVTVYGHGHRSHRCASGCSSYRAPGVQLVFGHGHQSHRCHSSCGSWRVDDRWSRRRGGAVVFSHGHSGHVCASSCGHYRAPRVHSPRLFAPRVHSPRIFAPRVHSPRIHAPHVGVRVSGHGHHSSRRGGARHSAGVRFSSGGSGVRIGFGFGSNGSRWERCR